MRILLLILAVVLPLLAQTPEPPPVMELTTEQKEVLKGIHDRYEDLRQDLQMRLKAKRIELGKLLRQDNMEKSAVKAKLDEILALEGERQTLFLNEIFEAKAQLKPQQWASYRRQIFRSVMKH